MRMLDRHLPLWHEVATSHGSMPSLRATLLCPLDPHAVMFGRNLNSTESWSAAPFPVLLAVTIRSETGRAVETRQMKAGQERHLEMELEV